MRELERVLGSVCRAVAIKVGLHIYTCSTSLLNYIILKVVEGRDLKNINEQMLEEILGVCWEFCVGTNNFTVAYFS